MESRLLFTIILLPLLLEYAKGARLLGCYKENSYEARLMPGDHKIFRGTLTPEKCISYCKTKGFNYAGLESSFECFCSKERPSYKVAALASECNAECDGNRSKVCGGNFRLSVYDINDKRINYVQSNYVGCYADEGKDLRSLQNKKTSHASLMTPEFCVGYCYIHGYRYAGVQNKEQCFCGDHIKGRRANEDECDMDCVGNPNFFCGGSWRNNVYYTSIPDESDDGRLIGCFVDSNSLRVLSGAKFYLLETNSPRKCISICLDLGYKFSGVEDRYQCYCGNRKPNRELETNENECQALCPKSSLRKCGGAMRVSVYSSSPANNQSPTLIAGVGAILVVDEDTSLPIVPGVGNHVVAVVTNPETGPVSHQVNPVILKPTHGQQVPTHGQQVPTHGQQQPTYGQELPTHGQQQPTYGQELPTHGQQQPTHGQQQPIYGQELPTHGQQQPTHGQQQPTYSQELPTLSQQVPTRPDPRPQVVPLSTRPTPEAIITNPTREAITTRRTPEAFITRQPSRRPTVGYPCQRSQTRVDGRSVCQGEILFEEKFIGAIDSRKWKHEIFMPLGPDFEFVVFDDNRITSFIENGRLTIRPFAYDSDDYIRRGTLNLDSKCTRQPHTEECIREGRSFNILPPVQSARITTKEYFSFTFGKVQVRAKLPVGDWIIPEIWLEPKRQVYGPSYASGRIIIAEALGNRYLSYGGKEIGCTKLKSGVVMGARDIVRHRNITRTRDDGWYKDFHNYTVVWKPDSISFLVDEREEKFLVAGNGIRMSDLLSFGTRDTWSQGTLLAPFDEEFYISIGLSVGGMREFPDHCRSGRHEKPWSNFAVKALINFWQDRRNWLSTWNYPDSSLQIDNIIVQAL